MNKERLEAYYTIVLIIVFILGFIATYGWLSGECGKDSVKCYKNIGNAEYYDCLDIKGDD